jgi:hypothetical protein
MIDFKGHRFEKDIILICVRWYLAYPLSYRNLEEMMAERGASIVVRPGKAACSSGCEFRLGNRAPRAQYRALRRVRQRRRRCVGTKAGEVQR